MKMLLAAITKTQYSYQDFTSIFATFHGNTTAKLPIKLESNWRGERTGAEINLRLCIV
jgi:hypothetical protein